MRRKEEAELSAEAPDYFVAQRIASSKWNPTTCVEYNTGLWRLNITLNSLPKKEI